MSDDGIDMMIDRAIERAEAALVSDINRMWTELPPRPVTKAEGELLNAVLMNMLSRLREKGVEVPDVAIVRVESVEVAR